MYDLIIIGAGPAGLTAGLYAGRFRLNTLLLEKMTAGGQIILSSRIENYPGFPGGIPTEELIERLKKQVEDLEIKIEREEVLEITPNPQLKNFRLKTENNSYEAKAIIIASGAQNKRLNVDGEDRLVGRGVSYCGTCDGPLFKDKEVVVIGGGDRALEEAIFLANYARKVSVIHRRNLLRASKILEEKAAHNPKICFVLESIVEQISGKDRVEAVKVKNIQTDSLSEIPCQGVFIFVGIKPNTDFLKGQLGLDEQGFIITDQNMQTSQGVVFACGDCRRKSLYQVINACGEGAVAADSVHKYLLKQ